MPVGIIIICIVFLFQFYAFVCITTYKNVAHDAFSQNFGIFDDSVDFTFVLHSHSDGVGHGVVVKQRTPSSVTFILKTATQQAWSTNYLSTTDPLFE